LYELRFQKRELKEKVKQQEGGRWNKKKDGKAMRGKNARETAILSRWRKKAEPPGRKTCGTRD
jgi:hypothetical protein